MGRVSKYLRKISCEGGTAYAHYCPGCCAVHVIWTVRTMGGAVWTFNGNVEKPTFHPSVRFFTPRVVDEDGTVWPEVMLCHYFITDGVQKFCGDSEHEQKEKRGNVPLIELPDMYSDANYGWPGK